MPATNATSEHSFSAMRHLKSYLQAMMTQERLNHLMMLHVHKDLTDSIVLTDVANEFVSKCDRRLQVFGKLRVVTFVSLGLCTIDHNPDGTKN